MRFTIAAAAWLAAAALGSAGAADLDEARRALELHRPIGVIDAAREVLAVEPRSAEAHRLLVSGLAMLERTIEAAPALERWAAEDPEDPTPLRILLDAYGPARDAAGLASIRDRVNRFPEAERVDVLREVTRFQLRGEAWIDAAETLALLPAPSGDAPIDRMFRGLEVARRGDREALFVLLAADPALYDEEEGDAVWWIHKILDLAPAARGAPGSTDAVADDGKAPADGAPDVQLPVLLEEVAPAYPEVARRAKIEGVVTIETTILTSGRTAGVVVLQSSNPMFNDAARRAILKRRYAPAMQNGRPVAITFTVVAHFRLRKGRG